MTTQNLLTEWLENYQKEHIKARAYSRYQGLITMHIVLPKGWKFSEGDDGIEFFAAVEDEDFLAKVRSREIKFENGTAVRAVLRTTQRKNIRTITDRTIVEIKEVISPSQNLF